MDQKSSAASTKGAQRKVKFAPKAPPKREQKLVLPKVEKYEDHIDEAQTQQLLRRLQETSLQGKVKPERKAAPTQVAFGFGGSSTSLKLFGLPKSIKNEGSSSKGVDFENTIEKKYKEPWDYYTNYPVTLPLRRPYSGNPELLDEEEFAEDAGTTYYDESESNCASDLGLMEDDQECRLLTFQFPAIMPLTKQSTNEGGPNQDSNTKQSEKGASSKPKTCNFEELPPGFMGKMLVYKSGAVKLKLGDTLYDVSPGVDCVFGQDVVAINAEKKLCCSIGEPTKRAVVTPNIDYLLDSIPDSDVPFFSH